MYFFFEKTLFLIYQAVLQVPNEEKLFKEYKKAIPELTIDESERLQVTNEKLKKEKSELEITRVEMEEMKKDVRLIKKYSKLIPKK